MKYMGSKRLIAKDIVPIIQKYIDDTGAIHYVEPFVGGANVIDKIKCKHKHGSDLNPYIIALHNHVKLGLALYPEVNYELYDCARKDWRAGTGKFKDWELGNIGFLASYNGRWFDGGYAKAGYTAKGIYRDWYDEAKRNLEEQSQQELYKDINFRCCDYTAWIPSNRDAVIYCDPPYASTKQYANATRFDYNKFWQWCRDMSKHNIVLISEQNAPDDFIPIWEKPVSRTMKKEGGLKSTEKLFIYKDNFTSPY